MNYKSIFFISPPFYSHFNPLLDLAISFKKLGVEVAMGCSIEFKERILNKGLNFYEINISKNKNVQKADSTDQPDSEKARLHEFFESTQKGAIETLITQSRHRKADMLYDPHQLINDIKKIDKTFDIDLYVVDVLSYSVTLALYSLNLNFITFCPPHPYTIPTQEMSYGVPKNWPSVIHVEESGLEKLKLVSASTQKEFTEVFNNIISEKTLVDKVNNAFSLVSNIGVIYNYFDFNNQEELKEKPYQIYIGNSFEEKPLDLQWKNKIDNNRKKILITLGTFLSNRKDVLKRLIKYTKERYPEAIIIVSAGENAKKLGDFNSDKIIIVDFIPQVALMPYVDLVIFHGGCNTFTEAMYYGKKMLVLPFSSDQFNIAYDIEVNELGVILDPNHFNPIDIEFAFKKLETMSKDNLKHFMQISQSRGCDFAAKIILDV